MSSETRSPADNAFEHRLLESARGDAEPRDVEQAWTRFAGSLGAVPLELGGASGHVPSRVEVRGRRAFAVKWMLVGALAGSGLTGALLLGRHPSAARPGEQPAPPPAPVARPPAAAVARPAGPAETTRAAKHHLAHAPAHRAAAPSTLAEEVSRIDTARVAIASGDYDEAMRLIARYHEDFPDGALAPDADVVALEAAAAKHDRAEMARRAESFLARYPNDPHTGRVERLAGHPHLNER